MHTELFSFVTVLICATILLVPRRCSADTIWLSSLDLTKMKQGYGTPMVDKSINGQPISIGGRKFAHGVGSHSSGSFVIDLGGHATRFTAWVGIDDDAQPPGSATFKITGDGNLLWSSGVTLAGEPPKEVNVDLRGVKILALRIGDGGNGNGMDHADWADARIEFNGPPPQAIDGAVSLPAKLDLRNLPPVVPVGKNSWGGVNPKGDRITVTSQSVEFNGKPLILVAGELHPTRTDEASWEESILKMKAGGLNTVSMYVLWNHIEQDPGVFDFTGNRNLRQIVKLCAKHGVWVWLRVGPFCNAEVLAGGLPAWLYGQPVKERSNDPGYLFYVERLYRELGKQFKGLMFKDGGPVIAIQCENEYEHATPFWDNPFPGAGGGNKGSDGESHMMKLKALAIKAGLIAPLYTCTAWGSPVPEGEFLATWGCYAYLGPGGPTDTSTFGFGNYARKYPLAFCELGGGTPAQSTWRPIVPPESVEVGVFTRVACGGNLTGIYMYHGGSNPLGKHGYLNVSGGLPIISYDFQAPIGEYGQTKPSYYHLRPIQQFLQDFGDLLSPMVTVWPEDSVTPENTTDLRYIARANGNSGFLFLNNFQDKLVLPDRTDVQVTLQLKDEALVLPSGKGLTLKSNIMAILPFNLPLGGANLKYATAQLMTKLVADGRLNYVFFAPTGMATEYLFDAATVTAVTGTAAQVTGDGGAWRVTVKQPGTSCVFDVTPTSGKPFRVLTLTHEQARHCLKVNDLGGTERLVLSDHAVISTRDTLRVSAIGCEKLEVSIYPNPSGVLHTAGGALRGTSDGVFTRYSVVLPKHKSKAKLQKVSPDKLVINLPAAEFAGTNDLFLRMSYSGDRGWAFIDGKLVADNFNNGTPWEIGLKRWQQGIDKSGLFVRIVPWSGDSSKIIFDGITFKSPEASTDNAAAFTDVQIVPEYAATLRIVR